MDRHRRVAGHDELVLLGQPDRNEIGQPEPLERAVRRVELAPAAVDHEQVGKRAAGLDHAREPSRDDLGNRGRVVQEPA
jgi:hypothetical protein